jgi:hypothetical protein
MADNLNTAFDNTGPSAKSVDINTALSNTAPDIRWSSYVEARVGVEGNSQKAMCVVEGAPQGIAELALGDVVLSLDSDGDLDSGLWLIDGEDVTETNHHFADTDAKLAAGGVLVKVLEGDNANKYYLITGTVASATITEVTTAIGANTPAPVRMNQPFSDQAPSARTI